MRDRYPRTCEDRPYLEIPEPPPPPPKQEKKPKEQKRVIIIDL